MRYISEGVIRRPIRNEEFQALAEFRYALRMFLRFSEDAATSAGITPRQYQAMLAVRGWQGVEAITIGQLAERLHLRHHSAVGLVQRLVRRGLIERRPLARDRRNITLLLTAQGRFVLEQLASAHRDELKRMRPQLDQLLETIDH